jgi:hypothetical protein
MHPHNPLGMHAGFGMLQAAHAPPTGPQAAAVLPGRQVAPAQQPPPHGCEALHAVGPHDPPLVVAMQTVPYGSPAQLEQKPPEAPQSNALPPEPTPVEQLFVPGSQQPPLQKVCSESPQVVSQTCVTMLQARSGAQSAAELQPQPAPPRHT